MGTLFHVSDIQARGLVLQGITILHRDKAEVADFRRICYRALVHRIQMQVVALAESLDILERGGVVSVHYSSHAAEESQLTLAVVLHIFLIP